MALPKTLRQVILYFSDPSKALEIVVAHRWPKGVTCPRCRGKVVSFISTRNVWTCKACKKQFSVKVGTIFEDSPIGLDKWLCCLWIMSTYWDDVSSDEVSRHLGVSQKSAWFMLHRLRLALRSGLSKRRAGEKLRRRLVDE